MSKMYRKVKIAKSIAGPIELVSLRVLELEREMLLTEETLDKLIFESVRTQKAFARIKHLTENWEGADFARGELRELKRILKEFEHDEEECLAEFSEICPVCMENNRAEREIAVDALRAISRNTCCDGCQEAKLVAEQALHDIEEE